MSSGQGEVVELVPLATVIVAIAHNEGRTPGEVLREIAVTAQMAEVARIFQSSSLLPLSHSATGSPEHLPLNGREVTRALARE